MLDYLNFTLSTISLTWLLLSPIRSLGIDTNDHLLSFFPVYGLTPDCNRRQIYEQLLAER